MTKQEKILRGAIRKEIRKNLSELNIQERPRRKEKAPDAKASYGGSLGGKEKQKIETFFGRQATARVMKQAAVYLKTDNEKAQAIVKFAEVLGIPSSKVQGIFTQLKQRKNGQE